MEEEIFKKCIILPEKLLEYGFTKKDKILFLEKEILNNEFKIVISYDNKIEGKIIDQSTNEEYINYRIETYTGEFVNKIRNEYISLLKDIKAKCTIKNDFIYNQTNRISKLIYDEYHDNPLFLWNDDNAVFRNKDNNKWYGIIMPINKNKISNEDKKVEVMNVKLPPDKIKELLNNKGYYPAYHMNKKYWITITLDDTISDNEIFSLVKISYSYTEKNKSTRKSQ